MKIVDIMQDKQVTTVEKQIRKNKTERLEVKSTVEEIKNTFNRLITNLSTAKEGISELKDPSTKITQTESEVKVSQSCLILCDPMDYTVHGIL